MHSGIGLREKSTFVVMVPALGYASAVQRLRFATAQAAQETVLRV